MNTRVASIFLLCSLLHASADERPVVAITPLGFQDDAKLREAIMMVMQAELSQSDSLTVVDRQQMDGTLGELKLAQQGVLGSDTMTSVGRMVGARYFVGGELIKLDDVPTVVVKVTEIETTLVRMGYATVEGSGTAATAEHLARVIESLVAKAEESRNARLAAQASATKGPKPIPAEWKRPSVMVIIQEMHVQQSALIDPAGETEIVKRLLAEGFRVADSEYVSLMKEDQAKGRRLFGSLKTASDYAASKGVDVLLYGEAISERGAMLGDFEGCRGRIELKAISTATQEILLTDSSEGGATDLSESVAGKKAIQQAANRLADTFLFGLADRWNRPNM